jgi:hypothetical protein
MALLTALALAFVVSGLDPHHHVPGIVPDHGMHTEQHVPTPIGIVSYVAARGTAVAPAGVANGTGYAFDATIEIG